MPGRRPERIVCLTAETTEIAFALGCGPRVVGVTGYAVRPPEARKKPRVAAFSTANVERILSLQPDLVLGFSDLQADIAAALIRGGANVLVTNQRTLAETADAMTLIAGALGEPERGHELVAGFESGLAAAAAVNANASVRPAVYFEEWDDPMISGIGWVTELVALVGGKDIFAGRVAAAAADRIVSPSGVLAAAPELIVASWCGKKANLGRIRGRAGWEALPAVRNGHVYEIKAPDILQPGPSLVHGAMQLARMVESVLTGVPYAQAPGPAAK